MGDGPRVGEVEDAGVLVLGHQDRGGQQVVEDGVAVGNVDDAVVLCDLGDKVTRVEVVGDRHTQPQDEAVVVELHNLDFIQQLVQPNAPIGDILALAQPTHLLDVALSLGVEAASEVGRIGLEVAGAIPGVLLVVLVDAACGEDGAVDTLEVAAVGQVECADDIGAHGVLLVVFAPVDIGATGAAGSVQNMCRLNAIELLEDLLTILHADGGGVNLLALSLEDGLEVTSNPTLTSPDEEAIVCTGAVGTVGTVSAVRSHLVCVCV